MNIELFRYLTLAQLVQMPLLALKYLLKVND